MNAITLNENNYPVAIQAPDEIWQYIGSKLKGPWDRSLKDLLSFRSTNTYFYNILLKPHWKELFQKYFLALKQILENGFAGDKSSGKSYFECLNMQIPTLSKETYRTVHRQVLEYLAKTAKERMRGELKKL